MANVAPVAENRKCTASLLCSLYFFFFSVFSFFHSSISYFWALRFGGVSFTFHYIKFNYSSDLVPNAFEIKFVVDTVVTSVSKKSGQTTVVIQYYGLSRFF